MIRHRPRLVLLAVLAAVVATGASATAAAAAVGQHRVPSSTAQARASHPAPDAGAPRTRSAAPAAGWTARLDQLVGDAPMSVAVGRPGRLWYAHLGRTPRVPASNEKLLLSMALLHRLGPDAPLTTQVRSAAPPDTRGRVTRLWLTGNGDPYTDRADLRRLARAVGAAGVRTVAHRVVAALGPFRRDDSAPGWKAWFPDVLVPLPTALTFSGNTAPDGSHLSVPEQRAAQVLTALLRARGVTVANEATTGRPPGGLRRLAAVTTPVTDAMGWMLQVSDNFAAEVLGKRLGWETRGTGSIAAAAGAICGLERTWHVVATCHDASGLSYDNRQTARGVLSMLTRAQRQPWGDELRRLLPAAGTGSLAGRLSGVDVRAKTGTLTNISALSGWVRVDSDGDWVAFSLLTRGISSDAAKRLEDRVVELIARQAAAPA